MKKKNPFSSQASDLKNQSNRRENESYSKKEGLTMLGELGPTLHDGDSRKVELGWKKKKWYDLGFGEKEIEDRRIVLELEATGAAEWRWRVMMVVVKSREEAR